MINAAKMTPDEKLTFIRDQILQCRAGQLTWMLCPYCGTENIPEIEYLCCGLFGEATAAILDRMEKQEAIDFLEQVSDTSRISKMVN